MNNPNDFTSMVNKLYSEAYEGYLDSNFYPDIISKIYEVDWDMGIVMDYGPRLKEVVEMVEDFSNNEYNRISKSDISFAASILLYYIHVHNMDEIGKEYGDIDTQREFTRASLKTLSKPLRDYRMYLYSKGIFLDRNRSNNQRVTNRNNMNQYQDNQSNQNIQNKDSSKEEIKSWGIDEKMNNFNALEGFLNDI